MTAQTTSPTGNESPERRPFGFWATAGLTTVAVIIAGVAMALVLIEYLPSVTGSSLDGDILKSWEKGNAGTYVTTTTLALISGALVLVIEVMVCASLRRGWTMRRYLALSPRPVFKWLMITTIIMIGIGLAKVRGGLPLVAPNWAHLYALTEPVILYWLANAIVRPLSQELLFRGFLFRGLAWTWLGPIGTIILLSSLSSVIFVPSGWQMVAECFVYGLLFGWARWKTNSVIVPLAMCVWKSLAEVIAVAILVANYPLDAPLSGNSRFVERFEQPRLILFPAGASFCKEPSGAVLSSTSEPMALEVTGWLDHQLADKQVRFFKMERGWVFAPNAYPLLHGKQIYKRPKTINFQSGYVVRSGTGALVPVVQIQAKPSVLAITGEIVDETGSVHFITEQAERKLREGRLMTTVVPMDAALSSAKTMLAATSRVEFDLETFQSVFAKVRGGDALLERIADGAAPAPPPAQDSSPQEPVGAISGSILQQPGY